MELTNRYFQGTWGGHKIQANAGASYCQYAASSSFPEYYVYGSYGASTAGHAPIAGDVLVWAGHVAIATNSVAPGATGTISLIEENATCTGKDTVSWNGSMFGSKYGLGALCWVHVVANSGAGATCPSGGNWLGAGKYCWDEPGMANTATDTLYSCGSAGGTAAVSATCSAGCQHMPAGQDDQCQVAAGPGCPTGTNWHGAGDYCWDQPGMTSTVANTLYSCAAAGGAATSLSLCGAGCEHAPAGQNDQCLPLQVNGTACTRGPQCSSSVCADGVCCSSACDACGTCASGTCLPVDAGTAGSPACDPYVCNGAAANCPTLCTGAQDCSALDYCDAGACVPTEVPGQSCEADDQCQSTHCVGGICCDSSCGPCGDCSSGTCSPRDAGSSGTPACDGAVVCSGVSVACPVPDGGLDAGPGADGGQDAGQPGPADGGTDKHTAQGCSCNAANSPWAAAGMLGLLLVVAKRRRRPLG